MNTDLNTDENNRLNTENKHIAKSHSRQIRGSKRTFKVFSAFIILSLLIGATTVFTTVNAQTSTNIVALKTSKSFILDGAPTEAFWNEVPAYTVPLVATTTFGGAVPEMSVRAVHDGSNIYLILQWADSVESRTSAGAQRIALSEPGNLVGGYAYNETHWYTDSAVLTWWLGSNQPTVSPAINNEFGGSPTRQTTLFGWGENDAAENWSWKSSALDKGNLYWPDAGIDRGATTWHWGDQAGVSFTMPHSSLYQGYWNQNGNLILGDGLLHAEGCQVPGTNPFEVKARGVWNSGEWTLELARSLVSSPDNAPYTTEFKVDETYYLVVGAMDGNKGEWEEVGSMSDWLSLTISNELIPSEKLAEENQAAIDNANAVAVQANAAAEDALVAANNALEASEDAKAAAESTTTLTYAAIGIAIVAIAVATIIGVRKR